MRFQLQHKSNPLDVVTVEPVYGASMPRFAILAEYRAPMNGQPHRTCQVHIESGEQSDPAKPWLGPLWYDGIFYTLRNYNCIGEC